MNRDIWCSPCPDDGAAATEIDREAEALAIFHALLVEKGYAEDPRNVEIDREVEKQLIDIYWHRGRPPVEATT